MWDNTGAAVGAAFVSKAHCCLAPSIWRRLLMQAFTWEVVRARTKLGMAMAANRPMMATTIMISTKVKPDLRDEVTFITFLSYFRFELAGGYWFVLSANRPSTVTNPKATSV